MPKMLEILNELDKERSTNYKIAVLESYKDSDLVKKVLTLSLNPYIQFYIKKIPSRSSHAPQKLSLSEALELLDKLSSRTYTGNLAREFLSNLLSSVDCDDAEVLSRIVKKDLRCGIAAGIVNRVFKDLIPDYPTLLASPSEKKFLDNIRYPAFSQLKADGTRTNIFVYANENKVEFYGRSGRMMHYGNYFDSEFIELVRSIHTPVMIDGESIVLDENGNIMPRKAGNGIITKAIKGSISDEEVKRVRFQVWDIIPVSAFNAHVYKTDYKHRFETIKNLLDTKKTEFVSLIDTRVVENEQEAVVHFQEALTEGFEGIILKNYEGIWAHERSKDLVKMKAEKEMELEVIGWNEGEGKYQGMLGSLVCTNKARDIQVNISGFTDHERSEFTPEEIIGKIITVCYNEVIQKKGSPVKSLYLARFVEVRLDKTEAD